jgi:hypothetical protein
VKLIVSGGAPLAPHVEEFLRLAMGAPVVQVGGPDWLWTASLGGAGAVQGGLRLVARQRACFPKHTRTPGLA